MLSISESLLDSFASVQTNAFVASIVTSLHEALPAEASELGAEALAAFVLRMLRRADSWNIEDSEAIGQLCGLTLGLGEDILDDPSVAEYLASSEVDAASRVALLVEALEEEC